MNPFDAAEVPLDGRILVEASAGTGKTHAITGLALRLVAERDLGIDRILIVTFTEAATAELRARLRARLLLARAAMSSEPCLRRAVDRHGPEVVRERIERALGQVDLAAVTTIHGFCHRVLQDRAVDAGLALDAVLEPDCSPLLREIAHDLWIRLMHGADDDAQWADPAAAQALKSCKVTFSSCLTLLDLATREPQLPLIPEPFSVPPRDRERWSGAWLALRAAWDAPSIAARIARARPHGCRRYRTNDVSRWCEQIGTALAEPPGDAPIPSKALKEPLERFTGAALGAAGFAPRLVEEEPFARAGELLDEQAEHARWQRQVAIAFKRRFIDEARAELPLRKARARIIGFDDLLSSLARALEADGGQELGGQLRARFPAALIDEFQDTDPLQWSIFQRIWPAGEGLLALIGDPKQAIYSFRGADVFAYLAAADSVPPAQRFTMTVNWRTDPSLLSAVSLIFARCPRPMLLPEIGCPAVAARPDARDLFSRSESLGSAALGSAPLRVLFCPRPIDKGTLGQRAVAAAAAEIDLLLAQGRIDGRPVRTEDVAVLTRKHVQALAVQRALSARAIASVVCGDGSVWTTEEAAELERLLRAVAEPSDIGKVRGALCGPLCGLLAADLLPGGAQPTGADRSFQGWLEHLRALGAVWAQRGVMAMFRQFVRRASLYETLLGRDLGERALTNVHQLVELLHLAERSLHLGPRALCAWLAARRADEQARDERAAIRLESDEPAVKITTVHRAKGLEFPIVILPFSWDGVLFQDEPGALRVRDGERASALQLISGGEPLSELSASAAYRNERRERLSESLRLLYVALTRAKHRTTLVWAATQDFETSALGYLLHGAAPHRGDPEDVDALEDLLGRLDDGDLSADLTALAAASAGAIEIGRLPEEAPIDSLQSRTPLRVPQSELRARKPAKIRAGWRIASFSQLTAAAGAEPAARDLDRGPGHDGDADSGGSDRGAAAATVLAAAPDDAVIGLGQFPRGAGAGILFHELLERADFTRVSDADLAPLVSRALELHGVESRWLPVVCAALRDAVNTPLGNGKAGLQLRELAASQRLNELEFTLPVAQRAADAKDQLALPLTGEAGVTAAELAAIFRAPKSPGLPADYFRRVELLRFLPVTGYLKGVIDLVFWHRGRWFLADYKTTHLGDRFCAYAAGKLPEAMAHGHYFLQLHLYALALHRFLARRVRGYEYGRHFGGVFCLFLRGMSPKTGAENGVFFDKPPLARIEALDRLLDRGRPER